MFPTRITVSPVVVAPAIPPGFSAAHFCQKVCLSAACLFQSWLPCPAAMIQLAMRPIDPPRSGAPSPLRARDSCHADSAPFCPCCHAAAACREKRLRGQPADAGIACAGGRSRIPAAPRPGEINCAAVKSTALEVRVCLSLIPKSDPPNSLIHNNTSTRKSQQLTAGHACVYSAFLSRPLAKPLFQLATCRHLCSRTLSTQVTQAGSCCVQSSLASHPW